MNMVDESRDEGASKVVISLASVENIRKWSHGEVKKPETINYRTLKPEKDGLFCEKIFGPTKDWECNCGKYKRVRFKGIVCERCGVEVTRSKVRRDRMGHIELAAPVTHIWYFKGVPSRLGYLLDVAPKDLEKVIYFAAYMVTHVDVDGRHENLPRLEAELGKRTKRLAEKRDGELAIRAEKMEADLAELEAEGAKSDIKRKVREGGERDMAATRKNYDTEIERLQKIFDRFKNLKVQDLEGDDKLYRAMRTEYGNWFEGSMGASAIQKRLETFDLVAEEAKLREIVTTAKGAKKIRALKRIAIVQSFTQTTNEPKSMVLEAVPVMPPDLRPMVQLDGGRFATSDLNDLYRRVINRNIRLKRLLDLNAPEIIVNNEKRMLQESVDALFANGRRGRAVTGTGGNRPLKSLSDLLKGKQGRFRQNLLGKRVDYSGRSVIVVGPQLKLHQCGLPKQMALELFKPFVMKRLVDLNHAQNIKSAKRMVERSNTATSIVWDVLEEVITEHPVLLNRAPTLHRLGIQAFEPKLIEGKAIQIHPLVCTAFNADFDGDQMAVHVPLSAEAQAEARILMLSSNNILSPASGKPITTPTQDMVLGIYHLTGQTDKGAGEGRAFTNVAEAIMAFDRHELGLQSLVKIRMDNVVVEGSSYGDAVIVETTLGRALFNDALPADYKFVNVVVDKKKLSEIINDLAERYPKVAVAGTLDQLKDLGFYWATRSGVSVGIEDVIIPVEKAELLAAAEAKAAKADSNFERGIISESERREQLVEIWTKATDDIADKMEANFTGSKNPVWQMAASGARGNMLQVRQLAGMRGLVTNTKGEIIPRPIKSNFREGLSMLEYFISSYGARKGLADTALRTADAGYLTRRLVDVSQDVIIREVDCETESGVTKLIGSEKDGKVSKHKNAEAAVVSRTLAEPVKDASGNIIANANDYVTVETLDGFVAAGVTEIKVRSVLTCRSKLSVCGMCYGKSLATNRPVEIGEAVGIIAAQSIGEPGTQLTMRTFHTGGVVGAGGTRDITHGLPRVVELFEARDPKGKAILSDFDGIVKIEYGDKVNVLSVVPDYETDKKPLKHKILKRDFDAKILVQDGEHVATGQQLTKGIKDAKDVLAYFNSRDTQDFLIDQVQDVYRGQGQSIHDKHIEVIVRQMLRRVVITDQGDSNYLEGDYVDSLELRLVNEALRAEGKKTASGRNELMGITKASLATNSWLSAASFQETTKVLTTAALKQRSDELLGLKENVILGNLIPAGTGLAQYRNVVVEPTEEAKAAMYASRSSYADDYGDAGFGQGSGEAIPLDDLRLNSRDYY
jgi:DNA-directed RNA polymerase subunit beta'